MLKPLTLKLAAILCLFTLPLTGHADNGNNGNAGSQPDEVAYAGLDLLFWEEDNSDASDQGFRGRVGYRMAPYFYTEIHLGGGGSDAGLELDFLYSAFFRGTFPVHEHLRLSAMVGLSQGLFSQDSGGVLFGGSSSSTETGFSYGAGVLVPIGEHLAINADYIRYLDTSEIELDAAGAGIVWRF